ncbi:hypothetical protein CLIB1444_06S05798 [[Candida] jaroonii]|uniref:Uncharacterized protein n=1 Tax=[Candida] jaroonii TaxID=467808 RepID=A0ACA9Y9E5_9ASCO|nr:hypothetical protein CLIB1444_06S05798 [[Candida] jaroonii]
MRKSFYTSKSWFSRLWFKIPSNFKYGTGLVGVATTIANVHPNILVTLGPPIGISSYFTYRFLIERQYKKDVNIAKTSEKTIKLENYDETDIDLVLKGINNEFEYFKSNILREIHQLVNSNIDNDSIFVKDDQINYKFGDFENFIVSNYDSKKFIKFSMSLFDKSTAKRLGIMEVYLTEVSEDEYKVKLVITPNNGKVMEI